MFTVRCYVVHACVVASKPVIIKRFECLNLWHQCPQQWTGKIRFPLHHDNYSKTHLLSWCHCEFTDVNVYRYICTSEQISGISFGGNGFLFRPKHSNPWFPDGRFGRKTNREPGMLGRSKCLRGRSLKWPVRVRKWKHKRGDKSLPGHPVSAHTEGKQPL